VNCETQSSSPSTSHGQVELGVGVLEDAQALDLGGDPVGLVEAVAHAHPEQDQQPEPDAGDLRPIDLDRGAADALYQRPH
jgi:hypothetical protein